MYAYIYVSCCWSELLILRSRQLLFGSVSRCVGPGEWNCLKGLNDDNIHPRALPRPSSLRVLNHTYAHFSYLIKSESRVPVVVHWV